MADRQTAVSPSAPPPPPRSRRDVLARVLSNATTAQPKSRHGRKVGRRDRLWLAQYQEQGFKEPEKAAAIVGFKSPGAGYRLELRLADLIDAARVRSRLVEQMELDEALMLAAEGARDTRDRKVQATFLQMILRVHGALSDKPPSTTDRRTLAKQVAEIVERIRSRSGPSTSIRLRAAMESASGRTGIDLTVSPDQDPDPGPAGPDLDHPDPSSPPLTAPSDPD